MLAQNEHVGQVRQRDSVGDRTGESEDLGFGHVRLWVLEGNERAQRFYRQHEWRLAEGLRKTEFVDGAPVSELAYDKDLADN